MFSKQWVTPDMREYNAIAYATPDDKEGGFLRAHSEKNLRQHGVFPEFGGQYT